MVMCEFLLKNLLVYRALPWGALPATVPRRGRMENSCSVSAHSFEPGKRFCQLNHIRVILSDMVPQSLESLLGLRQQIG